jgi:hypothetical protein
MRAQDYEEEQGILSPRQDPHSYLEEDPSYYPDNQTYQQYEQESPQFGPPSHHQQHQAYGQHQSYPYPSHQYGSQHRPAVGSHNSPYGGHGHERYDPMFHQQSPASRLPVNTFLRQTHGEPPFDDNIVPIDEAIAAHASVRLGPPSSSGIDPPEDEPPSLRKRGVSYRSNSVSSADPSQRSAFADHDSPYQDGSAFHGSTYHDGSAYHSSTYQEGSAYDDGMERQSSYYHEDAEHYSNGYGNEGRHLEASADEHKQPGYNQNDEQNRYDERGEYKSHDAYDRQGDYPPDEEGDRPQAYDNETGNGDSDVLGSYDDITPKASEEKFLATYSADDGYDEYAENSPLAGDENASPMHGSEFSVPTVSDAGYGEESLALSPNASVDYSSHATESNRRNNSAQFPPISPRSAQGSEYSQSSAMRGAQELLRRNRQKRLELAQRMKQPSVHVSSAAAHDAPDDEGPEPDLASPQSQESGSTWQTGVSEPTSSEVTGGSSMWDGDSNPDRSSRRALILQMARARMKSHGSKGAETEEEKKLDHARDVTTDIDMTVDLD